MTNPLLRAFEDIGQSDWHGELCTAELGPICIGVDPLTNRSVWYRDKAPAPDYATYSDGTPPDPAHENAGDRAARKTAELRARSQLREHPPGFIEFAMSGELPPVNPQPLYHGWKEPPEPAKARFTLDDFGLWSAYATAICVVGLTLWMFT